VNQDHKPAMRTCTRTLRHTHADTYASIISDTYKHAHICVHTHTHSHKHNTCTHSQVHIPLRHTLLRIHAHAMTSVCTDHRDAVGQPESTAFLLKRHKPRVIVTRRFSTPQRPKLFLDMKKSKSFVDYIHTHTHTHTHTH
jgi:hypothetical protein